MGYISSHCANPFVLLSTSEDVNTSFTLMKEGEGRADRSVDKGKEYLKGKGRWMAQEGKMMIEKCGGTA